MGIDELAVKFAESRAATEAAREELAAEVRRLWMEGVPETVLARRAGVARDTIRVWRQ